MSLSANLANSSRVYGALLCHGPTEHAATQTTRRNKTNIVRFFNTVVFGTVRLKLSNTTTTWVVRQEFPRRVACEMHPVLLAGYVDKIITCGYYLKQAFR